MDKIEKKNLIAGLYGNAVEWYDFLLYASFAPVFAVIFFPTDNKILSLIATFTLFAVSFLMRPLGGILFGHLGDSWGRRKALIACLTLMTIATICIAITPTFLQLGIIATLLFSFFRLLQGIAVGGELPGSATYLIEHTFPKNRGLAGSLVISISFLGILLGSLVAAIVTAKLTAAEVAAWGWRFTYLLGGVLGVYGIYLRIKSTESQTFLGTQKALELPFKLIFTKYLKYLTLGTLVTSILALANYILIYVITFLVSFEGFQLHDAIMINFIALLLIITLVPLVGLLSDYVGRKPIFRTGLIGLVILIFPIFWLLSQGNFYYVLIGEIILGLCIVPLNATVPTMLAEIFPTEVRASGVAIAYNLGFAIFGGTAPLIALFLVDLTGSKFAPAWYIFICAVIVLIALRYIKETYQEVLD